MSFQAMAWAGKQRTGSHTLKIVLLTLANYADEEGECFPSQDRLAFDTEMSERSVREALKKLEEMRLIERTARYGNGAKRRSDIIRLIRHPLPEAASGRTDGSTGNPGPDLPAQISVEPISEPTREKKKTASSSKRHRLPDDFRLTQARVDMGTGFGLDVLEVREIFDEFVDFWRGEGGLKADWDATLRNRFRKKAQFRSRQASLGGNRRQPVSYFDAAVRVGRRYAEAGLPEAGGDGGEDPLPF